MIHTLMKQLAVTDVQQVAKIGDTSVDLQEGTNVGCRYVIGVTTGAFTREQLLPYPHTHIVDSVRDVPAIILQ
jgi:phosphoglycolate phosphatase-like HAD superfamily hydrolase